MSTEIQCPSCHKQVEVDSAFCRHCGQPIPNSSRNVEPRRKGF